jgi:prepilin-type N-terminal cleavage/methylation domain-containing protein
MKRDVAQRGFTLLELMVVALVVAVVAALTIPSIASLSRAAAATAAVDKTKGVVAIARDQARGLGLCLLVQPTPAFPAPGPYALQVSQVGCAGDQPLPGEPIPLRLEPLSSQITSLRLRQVVNDAVGADVTAVRFTRDGSLESPRTTVQVDATVDGLPRAYRIYPSAGTIEEVSP